MWRELDAPSRWKVSSRFAVALRSYLRWSGEADSSASRKETSRTASTGGSTTQRDYRRAGKLIPGQGGSGPPTVGGTWAFANFDPDRGDERSQPLDPSFCGLGTLALCPPYCTWSGNWHRLTWWCPKPSTVSLGAKKSSRLTNDTENDSPIAKGDSARPPGMLTWRAKDCP